MAKMPSLLLFFILRYHRRDKRAVFGHAEALAHPGHYQNRDLTIGNNNAVLSAAARVLAMLAGTGVLPTAYQSRHNETGQTEEHQL